MSGRPRLASVTLLSALMFLVAGEFQPSAADSVVNLGCRDSKCVFEEALGKSMTKEFVARCHSGYNPYPWNIAIRNTAPTTTCTIKCRGDTSSDGSGAYITKSCTNWDPLNRDKIKVTVECGDWPKTTGGLGDTCTDAIQSD